MNRDRKMNRSNNITEITGWKRFLHSKGIGKIERKYYCMCLLGLSKQVEYLVRIDRKLFIIKIIVDWLGLELLSISQIYLLDKGLLRP